MAEDQGAVTAAGLRDLADRVDSDRRDRPRDYELCNALYGTASALEARDERILELETEVARMEREAADRAAAGGAPDESKEAEDHAER